MDAQTPVLKNNKIYKDGKLKKWFKRTIAFSICGVILGVGIGGLAVATSRPDIYLKSVKLVSPDEDISFNTTITFSVDKINERHPAIPGSTDFPLAYSYLFDDGNKKHWDAGYSVDWKFIAADAQDQERLQREGFPDCLPDGLWIEKGNNKGFGTIKWDAHLTSEALEASPPSMPFLLSILVYGPGGAKTGSGETTLSDSVVFSFTIGWNNS